MDPNAPIIFLEGIDKVIKSDLEKHKMLLQRSKEELDSYRTAVSHEVKKKRHYRDLVGGGKYNDDALEKAIEQIRINIRHLSDKVKLSNDAIEHHKMIVDNLHQQLEDYYTVKLLKEKIEDGLAN